MTYTPKIAIVGGGPGGLTLARILQHNQIPCTVFELDKSRFGRLQGGTLDIHHDSGQLALIEAGLMEQFKKHMRAEGEELRILNTKGEQVLVHKPGPPPGAGPGHPEAYRPEIDRVALRDMLLDSLDQSTIRWGHKLVHVEPSMSNEGRSPKFSLHFENGSTEEGFDLVVGADGAWSKVRPLVTDAKPFYSEITGVESHIVNVTERYPEISERLGDGSCFQLGESKALLAQRQGDGAVKTYAMLRVPLNWPETCGIDWTDSASAKVQLVKQEFQGWDQGGKDLILKSDKDLAFKQLWMLPIGLRWDSRPGVTLIGDAAHVMTPFAGVGVNLAMVDALDLAKVIKKSLDGETELAVAVQEYEVAMFERSKKNAQKTFYNLETRFSGSSAEEIAQKMKERRSGSGGNH